MCLLLREGSIRELGVVRREREVAQRVDEFLVDALAIVPEHLAPLRTGKRVLRHDVLDGEGAAREVQRVLRMPAVLERGEQVEAALERVAVARPERPPKLRVARHASGRPLLSQENRLIGLADVAAIVPHRVQPCDHGREELVQAVRRDVTHRATEEVALRGPQHGGKVVM